MYSHFPAAAVAVAASAAIPAVVLFVVRLRDRKRPDERISAAPGDAVVLSFRRWQIVVNRVVGIVVAVLGALMTVIAATRPNETEMLIAGIVLVVTGPLLILLASSLARFRVTLLGDRIDIIPMIGRPRSVPVHTIARIIPAAGRYGGVQVYDARRQRLFSVTTITLGFAHLVPFLQWNAPDAWEEFVRKYGRNLPRILGPAAPRAQVR
ncbi:hypothetical protein [Rathayibacter iranicus]|uniref:Uncharacterized protein n=2 Tax=Rathayibacter iranicus TaxID=59737 RepID=A0AAD1ADI5_9MICO|nr:hypothetical protein [Rathayibacter iranicus]AZZ54684.1 hypothetical protein C7V51_01360 [Rathayibacter iranicus]MWV30469.1 hypothetical protein [Rathayibacter iranicus NCPPB 2253 = VKM Ac-1602]PPI51047.1 hypothetical protein C5E09_01405 [Rathayibacter iranicus]PPI63463.1 hypothetical protein C5E08_01405 [Rathayibacter iranicus]PPI74173.1 hypothetical protein C5E01_01385 [Rathayibacter iranicus]